MPDLHLPGWYLPEAAHPYFELVDHVEIVFASPNGGKAPLDPGSIEPFKDDAQSQAFMNEKRSLWENTEKLSTFKGRASEFAALVYIGGHGPVWSVDDEEMQALSAEFWEAGKVVSGVCHGPIVLAKVKLSDGSYLVKGHEMTALSNAEEDSIKLLKHMPYNVETLLQEYGAKYSKADSIWGEKVVQSGRLITGQNPASASAFGRAILKAIS